MSCEKCTELDVHPDKDGKVRIRKDLAYRCLAELPPKHVFEAMLPHSVPIQDRGGYVFSGITWPPTRARMGKGQGVGCPMFTMRQGKATS